jgi:hypothetical protein
VNANTYLTSLGIEVVEAAQAAIGRLVLAGEFVLGGERGALIRPKRGDVSLRYLEILVDEGYAFVVVDSGGYPAFYAREGAGLAPVRALPIAAPQRFPTTSVLAGWAQLIRTAARRGEAARLGAAQLVAHLGSDDVFRPELISATDHVPIEQLGGDNSVAAEPLRIAAALLAGFRMRPDSPDELVGLLVALSSLLPDKGQYTGLAENLAPLFRNCRFGTRRLLVSSGGGAEVAALLGAEGTIVLPSELHILEPLLARLLPDVDRVFSDFLQSRFEPLYDAAIVIPPFGLQLEGAQLGRFELAKRGGKVRGRVAAEALFVEHALAALVDGGILVAVLPEGLLSSAGHADFRHWLLDQARLLAVISLPAGACIRATGVKCSVVLLQKSLPIDDYRILMVDVDADDMSGDIEIARAKLDEFLEREVAACA